MQLLLLHSAIVVGVLKPKFYVGVETQLFLHACQHSLSPGIIHGAL
jgi:hypothetical protein